jgi:hypothetical protein
MNENCETLNIQRKSKLGIFVVMYRFFTSKKEYKTINVEYPNSWSNCGIMTDNHFIADNNNSANLDTLKFPLPKPKYKWNIKCYGGTIGHKHNKQFAVLIDCP